jgi:hypothetical protein
MLSLNHLHTSFRYRNLLPKIELNSIKTIKNHNHQKPKSKNQKPSKTKIKKPKINQNKKNQNKKTPSKTITIKNQK